MSTKDAYSIAGRILQQYGFPGLVSVAIGFVLRNDVLLPLVDAHETFLTELTASQRELVEAMQARTASFRLQDDTPQN